MIGAARALEEASHPPSRDLVVLGLRPVRVPCRRGQIPADEVAAFTLGDGAQMEYVDVDWVRMLASLIPRAAKGFAGIVRGEANRGRCTGGCSAT